MGVVGDAPVGSLEAGVESLEEPDILWPPCIVN